VIFEAHQSILGAQIFGLENLKLEKDVLPGKWPTDALKDQMPPFVTLLNGFLSAAVHTMQLHCDQPDVVTIVTGGISYGIIISSHLCCGLQSVAGVSQPNVPQAPISTLHIPHSHD
jgi:hypothetical protein